MSLLTNIQNLERTFQNDCGLQHHHRCSFDITSVHSILESPSIKVETLENHGFVCDENHCLRSHRHPNTLFRHPRQGFRQDVGEHKLKHVGPVRNPLSSIVNFPTSY